MQRLLLILVPVLALAQAPITKESLTQRKAALEEEYRQVIANANALQGAIQDCEYWLEQLARPPAPPVKPAPKPPQPAQPEKKPKGKWNWLGF